MQCKIIFVTRPNVDTHQKCAIPESSIKQVGTPTKARAGFIKMGCLQEWEASVGFVF